LQTVEINVGLQLTPAKQSQGLPRSFQIDRKENKAALRSGPRSSLSRFAVGDEARIGTIALSGAKWSRVVPCKSHASRTHGYRRAMHKGTVQPDPTKLRKYRLEKDLTQSELAKKAGYTKKTVENAEAGKPQRPGTITAIAEALGKKLTDVIKWPEGDAQSPEVLRLGSSGSCPPLPAMLIGRAAALSELKGRLGVGRPTNAGLVMQVVTAVHGWPGVGKTSIALALAHDPEITDRYPDGVLWVFLGQTPDLLSEICGWGLALGVPSVRQAQTLRQASSQVAALLRKRKMLLLIDDVWRTEDAIPFLIGGRNCATLVTTRLKFVADRLAPRPGNVYKLDVLTDQAAIALLTELAPTVCRNHPNDCLALVRELEGLPLALQVAGRLLNAEEQRGLAVGDLLRELRQGVDRLLTEPAPSDMIDIMQQTTPTVAVLLQKSTSVLDPVTRERFIMLAPFAPKPATFQLDDLAAMWETSDSITTVRQLVDRGLLESLGESRFQIHAILVAHARSLCEG
jgi:transcriptional regulator with XRE-family HTH domain